MSSEEATALQRIIEFLLHIGGAVLITMLGIWVARVLRNHVQKWIGNPRITDYLGPSVRQIIVRISFYACLLLFLGMALIALGVPAVYVIGAFTIIFVIVGVALQQSLANLTATLIFFAYQPFKRGDLVETMGLMGTVNEIQLFNTVLVSADGKFISLANSKVQEAGVVNYTRSGAMRADVEVTVAYSADLARVRELLLEACAADARVLPTPAPDVVALEMNERGVRVALRAFATTADYWPVLFGLREQVAMRLEQEGIEFARSQSTVSLATEPPVSA